MISTSPLAKGFSKTGIYHAISVILNNFDVFIYLIGTACPLQFLDEPSTPTIPSSPHSTSSSASSSSSSSSKLIDGQPPRKVCYIYYEQYIHI